MKQKCILAVAFMVMAGCQKELSNPTSDVHATWELVSSDGAWFGHRDYPPGNGNTITFNGNTYLSKIKTPDTAYEHSGTFVIYNGKPCEFANEQSLIKFDNDNDASSYSMSNSMLTIGSTECIADGATSTFRKIQ